MPFIYLLTVLIAVHFNSLLAMPERYQLIDLGVSKYKGSSAASINDQGQVCGTLVIGDESYLFAWDPTKKLKYTKMRLSTTPKINNREQIFGSYWTRKTEGMWELDQETTYAWKDPFMHSSWECLGHPKSQSSTPHEIHKKRTCLWDCNDQGQLLVMNTPTAIEDSYFLLFNTYRTWIYEKGLCIEITNPNFTVATKINNHAQVLVQLYKYNAFKEIQTRSVAIYTHEDKSVQPLNFAGDAYGCDLNDLGQVAGAYYNPLKAKYCGFLVDQDNHNLLSFDNFIPSALNTKGLLIGHLTDKKKQPAIWDNGCLRPILEAIELIDDKGQAWDSILSLSAVNDRGEILGKGVYKGSEHAILLRPIN